MDGAGVNGATGAITGATPDAVSDAVSVVGIGADGWDGLPEASRRVLRAAGVLIGAPRQLDLLPVGDCPGERIAWPSPLRPAVPGLLAAHAGRAVAVLASGDPSFYGIGRTLAETVGADRLRIHPHPSSVSYACARLGWPLEETETVSLVARPLAALAAVLHPGRRILVLGEGPETPARVASLLRDTGWGGTRIRVLEQLGGPRERLLDATAGAWPYERTDALHVLALDCARDPDALRLGAAPGLPDEAYEHDGQLTKRYVRAATLAALAPAPGELLWDVGGGSGSIGIEWMRTHRACRAVAVEKSPERAARIARNADALGVPALEVVTGPAPEALAGLPTPDAVFVGGGLTAPGLLAACWDALPVGGRLVANTVTLESEALLAEAHRRHGGELVRLAVATAVPVGGFTGWRQAMPVTQWSATKRPAPEGSVTGGPGTEGSVTGGPAPEGSVTKRSAPERPVTPRSDTRRPVTKGSEEG